MFQRKSISPTNGGVDKTKNEPTIGGDQGGDRRKRPFATTTQSSSWLSGALALICVGFVIFTIPSKDNATSKSATKTASERTSNLRLPSSSSSSSPSSSSSSTGNRFHGSAILDDFQPVHEQCTVWMAPSSLKGFAGYGVFTTRDLAQNEVILGMPDGVAIPLEVDWDEDAPKDDEREDWWDVWGNYVWARGVPDHVKYYAKRGAVDFQIGFGSLPNHHCILKSLSHEYPIPPYDDTMVDRFRDPGAGAFTYSHGRQFFVKRPLKAGSEIFLSYGYCSHEGDHLPDWIDNVYVTGDYEEAASMIWQTIQGSNDSSSNNDESGVLQFDKATGKLVTTDHVSRLVAELLPQTKQDLDAVKSATTSKEQIIWHLATHKSINPHSSEWIRQHGMCLENLRPMPSLLPQAGQGAFAQYAIARDEIIMPAPLLQIIDKDVLTIYQDGNMIGYQLLLNYCFGHSQSSVLLCPLTQAQLNNHCSMRTQECGSQGPNAAIRWSRGWDATTDEWRKKSLEELAEETGRGLAFEVYALRDIQPGEEVTIDYGLEWEQAWANHVQTYQPPKRVPGWITAKEANDHTDEILPEFIAGDLRDTVKHPYLFTACLYSTSDADKDPVYRVKKDSHGKWMELSDEEILETFSDDGSEYVYVDKYGQSGYGYSRHRDGRHWPCSVLKVESKPKSGEATYTVRIHQSPHSRDTAWHRAKLPRILTSYKRSSIHYIVKPFAADQFITGAFRHPLGVPDNMFPDQWKNLE